MPVVGFCPLAWKALLAAHQPSPMKTVNDTEMMTVRVVRLVSLPGGGVIAGWLSGELRHVVADD